MGSNASTRGDQVSMTRNKSNQGSLPLFESGVILEGRYVIDGLLAEGGFAKVYTGRQLNIDRPVAIKILNRTEDDEVRRMVEEKFLLEAKSAAQITHPNVVTIFDYGLTHQTHQPFIVMELLEGHTLKRELYQNGPMSPQRAQRLFVSCLEALAEAHRLQIIHRDLKPANLFITNPGTEREALKVVDFGVARVRAVQATSQTAKGQIFGTPRYLPPEYLDKRIATPTLDVYQMGLVLVEALTGRPVLGDRNPFECIMVHTRGHLVLPVDLLQGPMAPLIIKALSFDHTKRLPDARRFCDMLGRIDVSGMETPGPELVRLDRFLERRKVGAAAATPVLAEDWLNPNSSPDFAGPNTPLPVRHTSNEDQAVPASSLSEGEPSQENTAMIVWGHEDEEGPVAAIPPAPALDDDKTTEWSGRKLEEMGLRLSPSQEHRAAPAPPLNLLRPPGPPRASRHQAAARGHSTGVRPTAAPPAPVQPTMMPSKRARAGAPGPDPGVFADMPTTAMPDLAQYQDHTALLDYAPAGGDNRPPAILQPINWALLLTGGLAVLAFGAAIGVWIQASALTFGEEPQDGAPTSPPTDPKDSVEDSKPNKHNSSNKDPQPSVDKEPAAAAAAVEDGDVVKVIVASLPPGADVEINDKSVGTTPFVVEFKDDQASTRSMWLRMGGHVPVLVDVSPADTPRLTFTLKKEKELRESANEGNSRRGAASNKNKRKQVIDKW